MTSDRETKLRKSRQVAEDKLQRQFSRGQFLLAQAKIAPDQFRLDATGWLDYNCQLLQELFTTEEVLKEYVGPLTVRTDFDLFADQYQREIDDLTDEIYNKLPRLKSILSRLEFFQEDTAPLTNAQPSPHTITPFSPPITQPVLTSSESRTDAWLYKIKNHPVVAVLAVGGMIIIGFGSFTDSLTRIGTFFHGEQRPQSQHSPTEVTNPPPDIPTGHLQITKIVPQQDNASITASQKFALNIFATNPGPRRIFKAAGYTKSFILEASEKSDKEVRVLFEKERSDFEKGYADGSIPIQQMVGIDDGIWMTIYNIQTQ